MPNIVKGSLWKESGSVTIPDWEDPDLMQMEPEEGEFEFVEQLPITEQIQPEPEPEPLTEEELRELYRDEWDQLVATAHQQAYAKAYHDTKVEYKQKFEQILEQMVELFSDAEMDYQKFLENYAQQMKYLCIDIAEKWLVSKIPQEQDLMESLVAEAVGQIKDAKWLKVELSDKMQDLAEKIQQNLDSSEFSGKAKVVLADKDVTHCVVHTDRGEIDASLTTQAENLRNAFLEQDQSEGESDEYPFQ